MKRTVYRKLKTLKIGEPIFRAKDFDEEPYGLVIEKEVSKVGYFVELKIVPFDLKEFQVQDPRDLNHKSIQADLKVLVWSPHTMRNQLFDVPYLYTDNYFNISPYWRGVCDTYIEFRFHLAQYFVGLEK